MQYTRRTYLVFIFKVLLLIGIGIASLPFLGSLRNTAPDETHDSVSPWNIEVSVDDIEPGNYRSIAWPGGEVWIYRRTDAELITLKSPDKEKLKDPESLKSQQPINIDKSTRSIHAEFFVFLAAESLRGCQITLLTRPGGQNRFSEVCYGSQYDVAGRIYQGTGRDAQCNLTVPPHEFVSATRLRMLRRFK
ncbi:hypothetical protein [Kaarinaea lacus]